jgi:hypothetical protein
MSKTVIYAPDKFRSIFLAGSIEMGTAEAWQKKVINDLSNDWIILNPRRADWDSSWVQSIDNPQFKEQVTWELSCIERADVVLVYIDPATKAPITLLELGILSQLKPRQTIMVCPDGYWRKGNVDIVCDRYKIKKFINLDKAMYWINNYE